MYVSIEERKRRKEEIVDLLRNCKQATCTDISIKLGIPHGTCCNYLCDLRRNHPNVSAVRGMYYFWVDDKSPVDTGICDRLDERLDLIYSFIRKKKHTTYDEIVRECGVPMSVMHRDINRLKSIHKDMITYGGLYGGIYWSKNAKEVCDMRRLDRIVKPLSVDNPKTLIQIMQELGICRETADKYMKIALASGIVVKTLSRSYVLLSECPADKLNDDMVRVWWYLKKHKKITKTHIYRMSSCTAVFYINANIRKMLDVSRNIHAIYNGGAYIWEDE